MTTSARLRVTLEHRFVYPRVIAIAITRPGLPGPGAETTDGGW
jgi:hypothetical protein